MNNLHKHYLKLLLQHKGMALLGMLLAVITAFSGIALLAVSGWFISAAALAGLSAASAHAFNFSPPGHWFGACRSPELPDAMLSASLVMKRHCE